MAVNTVGAASLTWHRLSVLVTPAEIVTIRCMTTIDCEGKLLTVQGQANKWVKNMEAQNGLRVLNLAMPDLLRQMENAIQFGNPVLLQVMLP